MHHRLPRRPPSPATLALRAIFMLVLLLVLRLLLRPTGSCLQILNRKLVRVLSVGQPRPGCGAGKKGVSKRGWRHAVVAKRLWRASMVGGSLSCPEKWPACSVFVIVWQRWEERNVPCPVLWFHPWYSVWQPCFGLVAWNSSSAMELCKAKAKTRLEPQSRRYLA